MRSPEDLIFFITVCDPRTVYVTEEFGPLATKGHIVRGTVLAVLEADQYDISDRMTPAEARHAMAEAVDALAYALGLDDPHRVNREVEVSTYAVAVTVYVPRWALPSVAVEPGGERSNGCPSCLTPQARERLVRLGSAVAYVAIASYSTDSPWARLTLTRAFLRLGKRYPHLRDYAYVVRRPGLFFDQRDVRVAIPVPTREFLDLFSKLRKLYADAHPRPQPTARYRRLALPKLSPLAIMILVSYGCIFGSAIAMSFSHNVLAWALFLIHIPFAAGALILATLRGLGREV